MRSWGGRSRRVQPAAHRLLAATAAVRRPPAECRLGRVAYAAAVAGAVLLAGALGGCGDGAEAPPGHTRFEGEGYSLAYPSGWRVDGAAPGAGDVDFRATSPPVDGGLFTALSVARKRRTFPSIGALATDLTITAPRELRRGKFVDQRDFPVAGAEGARVLTFEFSYRAASGEELPARAIELLAIDAEHEYRLGIGGPTKLLDRVDTDAILRSFRIE